MPVRLRRVDRQHNAHTTMEHTIETLLQILRRLPRDRFTAEAMRLCIAGTMPPVDLLHRCGIRGNRAASVLGVA